MELNKSRIYLNSLFLIILLLIFDNTKSYDVQDTGDAMQYLSRFGYIGKDTASSMNIVDAGSVLKQFQKMAGIDETGILDNSTMEMMNTPRCGNKDMPSEMIPDKDEEITSSNIRRKRFKLNEHNSKWKKRELTYHVGEFSRRTSVNPEQIERDVAQAFKIWSAATKLDFVKTKDKTADIQVGFTATRHQDSFPFDGPGKTLAHAFPPGPGLGGDVHFDEHEDWTIDSAKGTNVLFVAVHEIGHSLGLSHSEVKGAIMQAFYGGYRPHLKLHSDDIAGIQTLYGIREPNDAPMASLPAKESEPEKFPISRLHPGWPMIPDLEVEAEVRPFDDRRFDQPAATRPITTTPRTSLFSRHRTVTEFPRRMEGVNAETIKTTTLPPNHPGSPGFRRPDLCKDSKINAITALNDGFLYAFSGYYVFQIGANGEGVSRGWPSRIEFKFKELEPNIEAALTRPNGKTFFFKGGKYWRFTGFTMDKGYPKSIAKHFPGIPDHLDAAFENKYNGQMYFIKEDKFWRFDPLYKSGKHVSDIYPLPTSIWKLDEPNLDAALSNAKGDIYFFKDDKIYRFEEKDFELAKGKPAYPHSAKTVLYGCENSANNVAGEIIAGENVRRNLRNSYYENYIDY